MAFDATAALPAGNFPLTLGDSFHGRQDDPTYWSLRYDFKPASLSGPTSGAIRIGSGNQVCLDLSSRQPGQGDLSFSGHSELFDGLDCVAVFDGQSWRLELLAGSVKVRHVKGQNRAPTGLAVPPAAPAHLEAAAPNLMPTSQPLVTQTQTAAATQQSRDMSAEPSDMHQYTTGNVAASPDISSSSDSTTDEDTRSEDGRGTEVPMQHTAARLSPSPNVVASAVQRPIQVLNGVQVSNVHQNGHAAHAMPAGMTDLERQFFATQSPSSESSESSDSDESDEDDNENDGFEHF